MAVYLPDEIISEILSPALKVSDEAFSDTSPTSNPFAHYSESSSAFLLVCKAWLRVATPLLYHVVVLRSKAQAAALDVALRENPELGRFIKKLRVEGGYGGPMLKIIKAAPNITDLFCSINIWSSDNVSGLVRALPTMNPIRVIMFDTPYHGTRNKNSQLLLDTLKICVQKEWKNLAVFELPYSSHYSSTTLLAISSSLKEAPALKTLVVPAMRLFGPTPPEHLVMIAENPSLQSIELRPPTNPRFAADLVAPLSAAFTHSSLRGLVKIPENPGPPVSRTPTPPPSMSLLQYSTGSVPEKIWDRILRFAMARDVEWKSQPRPFWLVSKKFARLALPYLKESLLFQSPFDYDDFLDKLPIEPSLRTQVRTLYIRAHANINLRPIFGINLVNIVCLNPVTVTLKVFSDLVKFRGSTLRRLEGIHVTKSTKLGDPAVFSHFTNIRSLSLGFKIPFATSTSVPSGALATLEQLKLTNFDLSVMPIFSQMDLPALRQAAFPIDNVGLGDFLTKHGSKLQALTISVATHRLVDIFDACPALVDLTVVCGSAVPDSSRYSCSVNSSALETIQFETDGRIRGAERKWASFFNRLNIDTFPALRQIAVPCIRWPTTEHDIEKSSWVRWADRLLDRNVKLADKQGVCWRRRLKKK
ncbi:F-box domain-containing protein [Mycena venus]|uniref:F-box domain-containing protein n=1 Tax=Mycena venus TaxID=2733690 RepID=A0A8H6YV92_9AGAR|nr:F-box domain-containing protein [Mycena venus]